MILPLDATYHHIWESIGAMSNVNEMAVQFSNQMSEALDDIAPMKTFSCKAGYKAGLSLETNSLMSERDKARKELKT